MHLRRHGWSPIRKAHSLITEVHKTVVDSIVRAHRLAGIVHKLCAAVGIRLAIHRRGSRQPSHCSVFVHLLRCAAFGSRCAVRPPCALGALRASRWPAHRVGARRPQVMPLERAAPVPFPSIRSRAGPVHRSDVWSCSLVQPAGLQLAAASSVQLAHKEPISLLALPRPGAGGPPRNSSRFTVSGMLFLKSCLR